MNKETALRGTPRPTSRAASRNGGSPPDGTAVRVAHAAVPGRLRLTVAGLKRDAKGARRLEREAMRWPGVRRATASPVTGSLLLEFDPLVVSGEELVEQIEATRVGRAAPRRKRESSREDEGLTALAAELVEAMESAPVPPPPARRTRRLEAALGAAAVAGAGALLLAVRAYGHDLALDQAPLELAARVHHPVLTALMRTASHMVDAPVLVSFTAAATLAGVGRRSPEQFPWLAPAAVGGGTVLIHALKAALRRARPVTFAHLTRARGYSLPSGHAFLAMCLYGLLAHHGVRWLRSRRPDDRRAAALLVAAASALVLLVGISRVYLGVHYPTDVIAGYVLALLWLWLLAAINDGLLGHGPLALAALADPVSTT